MVTATDASNFALFASRQRGSSKPNFQSFNRRPKGGQYNKYSPRPGPRFSPPSVSFSPPSAPLPRPPLPRPTSPRGPTHPAPQRHPYRRISFLKELLPFGAYVKGRMSCTTRICYLVSPGLKPWLRLPLGRRTLNWAPWAFQNLDSLVAPQFP